MGHVTNVILIDKQYCFQEQPEALTFINTYLVDNEYCRTGFQLRELSNEDSGYKNVECDLYIGAFNYLDANEFLDTVAKSQVESLSVLIISQEGQVTYYQIGD